MKLKRGDSVRIIGKCSDERAVTGTVTQVGRLKARVLFPIRKFVWVPIDVIEKTKGRRREVMNANLLRVHAWVKAHTQLLEDGEESYKSESDDLQKVSDHFGGCGVLGTGGGIICTLLPFTSREVICVREGTVALYCHPTDASVEEIFWENQPSESITGKEVPS